MLHENEPLTLWYRRPAVHWTEALPLGNGRLGAMIFGGATHERIAINEDTLWSGQPRVFNNPHAREVLPAVRAALAAGDYRRADDLCRQMQGPYTESYQPVGDLLLDFAHGAEVAQYRRDLSLDEAVAAVSYTTGDGAFRRECFVSAPDQVMVLRLEATGAALLDFTAALTTPHPLTTATLHNAAIGTAILNSAAPFHVAPSYDNVANPVQYVGDAGERGMAFTLQMVVLHEGGVITATANGLRVEGARSATVLLCAATAFNGWQQGQQIGRDPVSAARALLDAARAQSYADLRARHVADHRVLFDRVALDLGRTAAADLPTDERLAQFTPSVDTCADPALLALFFQYGRYLLIASSRPGTQAANLQGIWNQDVRPAWSSNWTLNINAQMNYWHAESANLAECHLPLLDLVADLSMAGSETARVMYGCEGWCAHHNADIWRQTAPPGDYGRGNPTWSMWPMSGGWLCAHLWEHFRFGSDVEWLRTHAWPVLREAARFGTTWLIEDGEGGLVTSPSTSPENNFVLPDGYRGAVSIGATMDNAILRDLFHNCLHAAHVLGIEDALTAQVGSVLSRLPAYRIGRLGQLQEWREDWDDPDDHHRHQSHLYGVHPGREITATGAPELFAAAQRSLELRGDDGTGWSKAWKINFWARFGNGDRALRLLESMFLLEERDEVEFLGGGLYANLFDAHPPFQIDGNFGATAGMIEMLLQSHEDVIHLLPALPSTWQSGSIRGLRAAGGFEVGIAWQQGALLRAEVRAMRNGECHIRANVPITVLAADGSDDSDGSFAPLQTRLGVTFHARAGSLYTILTRADA